MTKQSRNTSGRTDAKKVITFVCVLLQEDSFLFEDIARFDCQLDFLLCVLKFLLRVSNTAIVACDFAVQPLLFLVYLQVEMELEVEVEVALRVYTNTQKDGYYCNGSF